MHGQGTALAETLAALAAFEGLLFAVDVPMISKVILPSKSLAANVTRVRSLIRMSPFMNQQIVRFRKLPITEFTDKLFLRPGCSSRRSEQSPIQVLMGEGSTRWIECRPSRERASEYRVTRRWFEQRWWRKQESPCRQFLPLVRHHGHDLVTGRGFSRDGRFCTDLVVRIRRGRRGRWRTGQMRMHVAWVWCQM